MLLHSGAALPGKVIIIDPGHGGADPGVCAHSHTEAAIVWDVATRLEGRLTALGVRTYLTRGADNGGDETQRAQFANATDANLMLSLHLDGHRNPEASGASSYYYGDEAGHRWSHTGKQFAGLLQRELVARCGFGDNRSHARTWTLLRSTKMAAVRLELGYLTNIQDAVRLSSPSCGPRPWRPSPSPCSGSTSRPRTTPPPAYCTSRRPCTDLRRPRPGHCFT